MFYAGLGTILGTKSTITALNSAKAAIQKYWEIGRQMIDEGRSREDMIKETDESYEIVRQARKFAEAYSEAEYLQLLAEMDKYKCPLGYTFLYKLLPIDDHRVRHKLQLRCIKEGWGRARLATEVLGAKPRQREGGRSRNVPKSLAACLAQIDQESYRWKRLLDDIAAVVEVIPPAVNTPGNLEGNQDSPREAAAGLGSSAELELALEQNHLPFAASRPR